MRSMWKGHLRFHLVTIPIKLYSAEEASSNISFNQLHRKDFGRIGYVKTCKKCGKEVSPSDIVSGYEYETDQYVVIEKEDIDRLKVKSTRVIEIEGFVDTEDVSATLYEQPYFIGPDGPVATKTYALLQRALEKSGKLGIGRVVLHDRESMVAMTHYGPGLILYKLRYPHEVRKIENVPQLETNTKVNDNELKLAEQLISTMSIRLKDVEFVDHYQQALQSMVMAKVEGKEFVTPQEVVREAVDILSALEASIRQAKTMREPMQKATGKRKETKTTRKAVSEGG